MISSYMSSISLMTLAVKTFAIILAVVVFPLPATAISLKTPSIVVAAAPMLIVYPFVQKYFEKGVMIGAVKG